MAFTQYEGPGKLYINGRLLAEAKKCTVRIRGNNNQVMTMHKGLAGKSDGVRTAEASIDNAVPRKGYEVDFVALCISGKEVSLVCLSGGRRHQFPMWVEDCELANGTDQDAGFAVTLQGGAPKSLGG